MNPDLTVYFNQQFVPLAEAKVGVLTHAFNYGTGVFEGIRGYWDAEQRELYLLRPAEHYQRWKANAGILYMNVAASVPQLCDITAELCRRNRFETDIYVRPLAYKASERIGVSMDANDAFSIVATPFGIYLDSRKGLHAGVVSWRRVEDNAIPGRAKCCGAYVNSALATEEAHRNGFDEAIFLSEDGHVAEGATCNIFLMRKGKLITPAPSDNVLEGITRDCILELARREMKLEVIERRVDRSELYIADEIFFTGTAVEVGPVVKVDHRPVGDGQIGPVATELRRLYVEATRGRMAAYRKWVVPVYHPEKVYHRAA